MGQQSSTKDLSLQVRDFLTRARSSNRKFPLGEVEEALDELKKELALFDLEEA